MTLASYSQNVIGQPFDAYLLSGMATLAVGIIVFL